MSSTHVTQSPLSNTGDMKTTTMVTDDGQLYRVEVSRHVG